MIKYEDDCCGCATESYPCMGSNCPNRNVKHLYCDRCGDDVEELYLYGHDELCEECLLDMFDKKTIDD